LTQNKKPKQKMNTKTAFILILLGLTQLASAKKSGVKSGKSKAVGSGGAVQESNKRCTEFKDQIESEVLLQVPCLFVRLMEQIKHCPVNSFIPIFLGKHISPTTLFHNSI
jgi:hypothetical protein